MVVDFGTNQLRFAADIVQILNVYIKQNHTFFQECVFLFLVNESLGRARYQMQGVFRTRTAMYDEESAVLLENEWTWQTYIQIPLDSADEQTERMYGTLNPQVIRQLYLLFFRQRNQLFLVCTI